MRSKSIVIWLFTSAILTLAMIALGGITRLTHSGLSMTEWQLLNILPPLNQGDWILEFAKYKTSPEFQQINFDMTISDFQNIFWLEYLHRLLGRITGLTIILPMLFFYYHNYFEKGAIWPIALAILVCIQGIIGWYMVKSGLALDPNVSHFRLSTHLICAILLFWCIIWKLFFYMNYHKYCVSKWSKILLIILFCLSLIQIILGGFVAGLKAGMIYNQFPLMGESFIPHELFSLDENFLYDRVFIQFLHRIVAYLILILSLTLGMFLYKQKNLIDAIFIIFVPLAQSILGIATLIYMVPTALALMHQMLGVFWIGLLVFYLYSWQGSKGSLKP